jgi:mono/diheme cytochrome c family protein
LLGLALVLGAAVAACSGDPAGGEGASRLMRGFVQGSVATEPPNETRADDTSRGDAGASTPTNSPTGKAFYTENVHPTLATTCGPCHGPNAAGPNWLTPASADASYAQLFAAGYVVHGSPLTVKGAHGGAMNNVLTSAQIKTFDEWVDMELKDGGEKSTPSVLEKLANCLDEAKFNAIGLDTLTTTTRTNANNEHDVSPWNENQNNCTGCKKAGCQVCHSADGGSGFKMALGNNLLPAGSTFAETKLTTPPYLQKYFGVSPTGEPQPSNAIIKKSESTKMGTAYSHPLFTIPEDVQTNLQAFVDDAIAKYKAGTCGK